MYVLHKDLLTHVPTNAFPLTGLSFDLYIIKLQRKLVLLNFRLSVKFFVILTLTFLLHSVLKLVYITNGIHSVTRNIHATSQMRQFSTIK